MKSISPWLVLACGLWSSAILRLAAQGYNWTTLAGGPSSELLQPYGVTTHPSGSLFVADRGNSTIWEVTPDGSIFFVAGSSTGLADGTNFDAQFNFPSGIAADAAGNLYVADFGNNAIRKLAPGGADWVVTTLAGNGTPGSGNGVNTNAQFSHPTGVAVDGTGNLYVADEGNNTIRKLAPVGTNWVVTTLAGQPGSSVSTDGTNSAARFASPWGIAVDRATNLYVTDFASSRVRKLRPVGTNWVVTTLAGSSSGATDATNTAAQFSFPMGIAVDSATNLYVADFNNDTIRKVAPSGTNWVVTTIGGTAGIPGSNDAAGGAALFDNPRGATVDSLGNLYVADTGNALIRLGQAGFSVQASLIGNRIVLSWPVAATNYVLETTAKVGPAASWSSLTNGVASSGGSFYLTNNASAASAFYRLRK